MHFRKLPDNLGMIYMPECAGGRKKHPCPDCFSCQQCSNERCRVCQDQKASPKKYRKPGRQSK